MKPISIQLYTVRDLAAQDFFGVLQRIAALGYVGVEPAGLHGKKPAEVRKVLDDLGLVCSSAHMGVPGKQDLAEYVDTAKTLGFQIVVSGLGPGDFQTPDALKAGAARFQAAAEMLKPHGLKMGYHNHWWEFGQVNGRLGYEALLELAPLIVSQLDIYWACNFGAVDVPALLKKHAARVPLLHVKDGPLVQGRKHTAVGAGKVNVPAVVQAADEKTLRWLIVELDECDTDMMQAVAQSYKYLTSKGLAKGKK